MSTQISRLYSWASDKLNNIKITASRQDAELDQLVVAANRKVLCSGSSPSSPIAGQTWVDTTNKQLKLYRNNEWVIQGIVHVGATSPTTSQEGDLWYKTSDDLVYKYDGSSWTTVGGFTPTAANALAGSVVQTVNAQTGEVATGTGLIDYDNTIPQNTEGDQYMTVSITPTNASNKLEIDVFMFFDCTAGAKRVVALFKDSTADALAAGVTPTESSGNLAGISFRHTMVAGTTSAIAFKVRAGGQSGSAGTTTINGANGSRLMGGVMASSITVKEIKV